MWLCSQRILVLPGWNHRRVFGQAVHKERGLGQPRKKLWKHVFEMAAAHFFPLCPSRLGCNGLAWARPWQIKAHVGWPAKGLHSFTFWYWHQLLKKRFATGFLKQLQNEAGSQPEIQAGYQLCFEAGFMWYIQNVHQPGFKAASSKSRLPAYIYQPQNKASSLDLKLVALFLGWYSKVILGWQPWF